MSSFTGGLTIAGTQSRLDAGNGSRVILMAGIPDIGQATVAATQFLQSPPRSFTSGRTITVLGEAGDGIIVMTDAFAAGPLAIAERARARAAASRPGSKRQTSKRGAKKSVAREGSKKTASKKKAGGAKKARKATKAADRKKRRSTKKSGGKS